MSVLSGRLQLHDVEDVEALVVEALRGRLRADEHEDCVSYVVGEVWRASLSWEPGRGSFSSRAWRVAQARYTDWLRREYGRSKWQFRDRVYERPRPELVSLDAPGGGGGRLGDALRGQQGDSETDSAAARSGLHVLGDSDEDRDHEILRDAARRLSRR